MNRLPRFPSEWLKQPSKNSVADTKSTSQQVQMTGAQDNRVVEEVGLQTGSGDHAAGILGLRENIAEQEAKQKSGSASQRPGGSKQPRYMLNFTVLILYLLVTLSLAH